MSFGGRSPRWWLAVVTGGALLLRLAVVALGDRDILGFNDQAMYHDMAASLAGGDGYRLFGEPTLRWPPAYPFLLSLVYRALDADVTYGFVLNALLSTAAVPLTMVVGRACAGLRVAVVAGIVVALLPGQWLFATTLLTEPLATLQVLLVLALAVRWNPGLPAALALAAVVASAALTRGEGPLLLAIPLVVWWAAARWRATLATVAGAAVLAGALVAPWAARNHGLTGEPVLSLNAGETLYAGHNPDADGGATYAPSEVLAAAADVPLGPERELTNYRLLRTAAREWALANPAREGALVPLRLWHLLEGDGNVVTIWIEADTDALSPLSRPLEVLADVAWYLLLGAFAAAAIWRHRGWLRTPWIRGALVLPALAVPLYGIVLYGNFRYRIPTEPLLVLVAAASLLRRPKDCAAVTEPA